MNCCLSFLFFCCVSGIVVFIILGIFTYTNNSFLIMENMRKNNSTDYVLFDQESKKEAYLQYFIAALFDSLFALLIYSISIFCENRKTSQKPVQEIQNIKNEIAVINSVGTHDNIIEKSNKEENINNIDSEINTNKGMTEKEY